MPFIPLGKFDSVWLYLVLFDTLQHFYTKKTFWHFGVLLGILGKLGPEPAFGRLGLGGSSGGYSSHGYSSHVLLLAYSTQLGGDRLFFKILTKDGEDLLLV